MRYSKTNIHIPYNTIIWIGGILSFLIIALFLGGLMYALDYNDTLWTTLDASRFHSMAETILKGLDPYVDYIDPKPPLLFFTIALFDLFIKPGSIDIILVSSLNIFSAILIWKIGWEDYGWFSGYIAGLLFLIGSVFAEGYLLYSEQFAVIFILGSLIFARNEDYVKSGICLGFACGYKQYALLAIIPLVYYIHHRKGNLYNFFISLIAIISAFFIILFVVYGDEVGLNALYYTFGIGLVYTTGDISTFSTYVPHTPFAFVINLIGSIAMVVPMIIFTAASLYHNGLQNSKEKTLGLFLLVFMSTLLIRQYLHYWILILPFLSLLSARMFEKNSIKPAIIVSDKKENKR